jgi:ATP-dependent Clp protease protease subunit
MTTRRERKAAVSELSDEVLVVTEEFVGARSELFVVVSHHPTILSEVGSEPKSPTNLTPMAPSIPFPAGSIPASIDAGSGDPRFDVFGRLMKNRVVMLGTDVNDDMANQICAQLLYLEGEDPNADIWLYINSPGGSITAGMAIYDTMQFVSCDVATVCMGLAASMGQFLLTAGTKSKRYTLPNARIMMHQPLAGLRGQATDIAIQAEQLAHIKRKMAELTSLHSGKPIEQIQADSERDRWFTAEEAQHYGLVDKVIVKRGEIR